MSRENKDIARMVRYTFDHRDKILPQSKAVELACDMFVRPTHYKSEWSAYRRAQTNPYRAAAEYGNDHNIRIMMVFYEDGYWWFTGENIDRELVTKKLVLK